MSLCNSNTHRRMSGKHFREKSIFLRFSDPRGTLGLTISGLRPTKPQNRDLIPLNLGSFCTRFFYRKNRFLSVSGRFPGSRGGPAGLPRRPPADPEKSAPERGSAGPQKKHVFQLKTGLRFGTTFSVESDCRFGRFPTPIRVSQNGRAARQDVTPSRRRRPAAAGFAAARCETGTGQNLVMGQKKPVPAAGARGGCFAAVSD